MKRLPAFLLLASAPLMAQAPLDGPLSGPTALVADAGNDFFERGKNLYDAAKAAEDPLQRERLFDGAATVLRNYLVEFPDHENSVKAWWYLGDAHFKLGRVHEGRRCFGSLLSRYEEGVWVAAAAYTLAADHYNRGEYAMAAPLFERYAKHVDKPLEKVRGTYFAGNCYRMTGKEQRAAEAFRQVVEDPAGTPFVPKSELALAHLTVKLGRAEDAYSQFVGVAAREFPADIRGEALLHAALTARRMDKREVAAGHLEEILKTPAMAAFHEDARSTLMANHFEQGQHEQVIQVFLAGNPQTAGDRWVSRLMLAGRAAMRLDRHPQALQWFRQVERLVDPSNEVAFKASFYRLLCFYRLEGRHLPDQVDAFLELYRPSRPNDFRIHTALMMKAETLHAAGELGKAALVYGEVDAARVSDANRPGLLYQRGWCLAEAGDHPGAIRSLGQFIRQYPEDSRLPSALARRAKSRVEIGKPAQAIADYDRLIQLGEPEEMVSLGWLESARLRRTGNQISDMVTRYRGLLRDIKGLDDKLAAEANYWIGWGLVKSNEAKTSIAYLQKARELRGELYRSHSGILLALGYFAAQDAESLAREVDLAIDGGYAADLPDQALRWSGMQSYNAGNFDRAARFLELICNREEPRETPKEVWRYLAKSQLELGQAKPALQAVDNVLEVEENLAWRADGLLDRGTALFALDRHEEARAAVDDALALQPQGRTRGRLRLLSGDLEMTAGDPQKASAQYLIVVSFLDDQQLKPLALSKLVAAFEAQDDAAQAGQYRQQLADEFPDWKAP